MSATLRLIKSDTPAIDPTEIVCSLLASYQDDIQKLTDERSAIRLTAAIPATLLLRMMLTSGQKSKKVGDFTVHMKYDERRFCACHGGLVHQCDGTPTEVYLETTPRVYVVRNGDANDIDS